MKYVEVENLGACLKNADYCALFPYCCRTPFHGTLTMTLLLTVKQALFLFLVGKD